FGARGHDAKVVGALLGSLARHLGDQWRGGDPERDGDARLGQNTGPQRQGRLGTEPVGPQGGGLIDGMLLDERALVTEDRHDAGGISLVELVSWRQEERVRCEAQGDGRAEAAPDSEGPGRIVRRGDDPARGGSRVATDDHGPRVVGEPGPLGGLDREVEAIAVEEQVTRCGVSHVVHDGIFPGRIPPTRRQGGLGMNTPTLSIPSLRDKVAPEEWAVRVDLAACYRLVAHYGWEDLVFTHITARVPGTEDQFLINPYGMFFDEITASSLVKIDIHGSKVQDSPYPVNPAGFVIHSAIHAARHDARCVLHTHTLDGVAVSTQRAGLLPISQHSISVLASRTPGHDLRAGGPRRRWPGSAPVGLPSRRTISPFTTVAEMPRARCTRRRAPAGRSCTTSGISGAILSASKTRRSAASPSR